jgi:hypothetical protein
MSLALQTARDPSRDRLDRLLLWGHSPRAGLAARLISPASR